MHSDQFLFFFVAVDRSPSPASIFITLDVRISISPRCIVGRWGNKFLHGNTTRYMRVIPLPGQHPKSVPYNAYTLCKVQSWPVYVGCTRFHFNCTNNVSRCASGDFISNGIDKLWQCYSHRMVQYLEFACSWNCCQAFFVNIPKFALCICKI